MILSGTGGCLERLDYAPFGGQISRSGYDCYGGASSEKPLFTGQMRDGESTAGTDTGQDYFNARYFWANTARFTSPDAPFADQRPEDGQSWNMYAYVRNNPLRYVDPSGNVCVVDENGNQYDDFSLEGSSCSEVAYQDLQTTSTETTVADYEGPTWYQQLGLDPFFKLARAQQDNIDAGRDPSDFRHAPQLRAEIPFVPAATAGRSIWTATSGRSPAQNAFRHWKDHSREFPSLNNAKAYVEEANRFVSNPPPGTLMKVRPNGDTILYHPTSNTFAVKNAAGSPRTMFRPNDGLLYFLKQ